MSKIKVRDSTYKYMIRTFRRKGIKFYVYFLYAKLKYKNVEILKI